MFYFAIVFREHGKFAEAQELSEQTLEIRRRVLGPEHPDTLKSMNNLAWLLATCPVRQLQDIGRAVELAKKAAALEPKTGTYWNTLGVAQYRAGDWEAAIEALEKSMELSSNQNESFDTIFLAMAHWQMGNKDEARKWYDRGVEWMEKNWPDNEELRRFRAEAAELLGIDASPPEEKEEPSTEN
jgi:tetratricopeptide (TPR) repeat protein